MAFTEEKNKKSSFLAYSSEAMRSVHSWNALRRYKYVDYRLECKLSVVTKRVCVKNKFTLHTTQNNTGQIAPPADQNQEAQFPWSVSNSSNPASHWEFDWLIDLLIDKWDFRFGFTFLPLPHSDCMFVVQANRQQEFSCGTEADRANPSRVETAQHGQSLLSHGVPHVDGGRRG